MRTWRISGADIYQRTLVDQSAQPSACDESDDQGLRAGRPRSSLGSVGSRRRVRGGRWADPRPGGRSDELGPLRHRRRGNRRRHRGHRDWELLRGNRLGASPHPAARALRGDSDRRRAARPDRAVACRAGSATLGRARDRQRTKPRAPRALGLPAQRRRLSGALGHRDHIGPNRPRGGLGPEDQPGSLERAEGPRGRQADHRAPGHSAARGAGARLAALGRATARHRPLRSAWDRQDDVRQGDRLAARLALRGDPTQ